MRRVALFGVPVAIGAAAVSLLAWNLSGAARLTGDLSTSASPTNSPQATLSAQASPATPTQTARAPTALPEPESFPPNGTVEFTEWIDDTATLRLQVPDQWSDVETEPMEFGIGEVLHIGASTDLAEFRSGYAVSGVDFFAVPTTSPFDLDLDDGIGVVLDLGYEDRCQYEDETFLEEDYYFGSEYVYVDCDGIGTDQYIWTMYVGDTGEHVFVVAMQLTAGETSAGEIVERVFASFDYTNFAD